MLVSALKAGGRAPGGGNAAHLLEQRHRETRPAVGPEGGPFRLWLLLSGPQCAQALASGRRACPALHRPQPPGDVPAPPCTHLVTVIHVQQEPRLPRLLKPPVLVLLGPSRERKTNISECWAKDSRAAVCPERSGTPHLRRGSPTRYYTPRPHVKGVFGAPPLPEARSRNPTPCCRLPRKHVDATLTLATPGLTTDPKSPWAPPPHGSHGFYRGGRMK